MKLIAALGLDLRILLAQFINFGVLIFVLWRFAYKPVFKILEERRAKIAAGVKNSEDSELKFKEAVVKEKEIMAEARKEANNIIDEAKQKAEIRYQEIVGKSKADIALLIEEEKEKIANFKQASVTEIKKEMVDLIVVALEKILLEKVDSQKDNEIIARVVKELV